MIRINKDFIAGTVAGFGAGMVFRAFSGETPAVRNVVKGAIKGVITAVHKLKESAGHMKENLSDLAAEVTYEMKTEDSQTMAAQTKEKDQPATTKAKGNGSAKSARNNSASA
jgi:hypothetical protein